MGLNGSAVIVLVVFQGVDSPFPKPAVSPGFLMVS